MGKSKNALRAKECEVKRVAALEAEQAAIKAERAALKARIKAHPERIDPGEVMRYSLESLRLRAVRRHNAQEWPREMIAFESSDPLFLLQIELDYLLEKLSATDARLKEHSDLSDAQLRSALVQAIVLHYPHLKEASLHPRVTEPNPPLLGRPGLLERGWIAGRIERFLGAPDRLVTNPHRKKGPPMGLFLLSRVTAIEASDAYAKTLQASLARQAAAQKGVATKKRTLLETIDQLEIVIEVLPDGVVLRNAVEHYNERQNEFLEDDYYTSRNQKREMNPREATLSSDPNFLLRITVNFLRHVLSSYEQDLERIYGRVGTSEAYLALRHKIFAAIADAYPSFRGECLRQQFDQD